MNELVNLPLSKFLTPEVKEHIEIHLQPYDWNELDGCWEYEFLHADYTPECFDLDKEGELEYLVEAGRLLKVSLSKVKLLAKHLVNQSVYGEFSSTSFSIPLQAEYYVIEIKNWFVDSPLFNHIEVYTNNLDEAIMIDCKVDHVGSEVDQLIHLLRALANLTFKSI